MQLTTLVEILRSEIPGLTERASTRHNLTRLYAERGLDEQAELASRGAEAEADAMTLEASVAKAAALAKAGRLDDAKREARRILASGDVPPHVSTKLRGILVRRAAPARRVGTRH